MTKDDLLLEQAYYQILAEQQRLITEGDQEPAASDQNVVQTLEQIATKSDIPTVVTNFVSQTSKSDSSGGTVVEYSGTVSASSPEEAMKIISDLVKAAIEKSQIDTKNLSFIPSQPALIPAAESFNLNSTAIYLTELEAFGRMKSAAKGAVGAVNSGAEVVKSGAGVAAGVAAGAIKSGAGATVGAVKSGTGALKSGAGAAAGAIKSGAGAIKSGAGAVVGAVNSGAGAVKSGVKNLIIGAKDIANKVKSLFKKAPGAPVQQYKVILKVVVKSLQ